MDGGFITPALTRLQLGYAGLFALAALACLAGLARIRAVPDREIRWGLGGLLALSAAWAGFSTVRLLVAGPALQRTLYILGLVVGLATVFAWLYFTASYAGRRFHRSARLRWVAGGIYVAVVTVKLTNPIHHGYFAAEQLAEPFPHLAVYQTPVHWVVIGLTYAGAGLGFYLLYDAFAASRQDTRGLLALATVAVLPVVADAVAVVTPSIPEVSFESIGVAVFAVGVLFFVEEDFLRARVTARRALLTEHPDPTLAVDDDGRLLDYNDEATALFEGLEPRASLESVAPTLAAALSVDAPRLSLGDRSFAVRRDDVPIRIGRAATTVVLREVTEAERHRAEIERQNEQLSDIAVAIAHNLRNASNVLQGHIGRAATARAAVGDRSAGGGEVATGASAGDSLDIAATTAERVAAVAEDLRLLAELGQTVEHTNPVPLAGAAREAWGRCDADGPTLECESFGVEADRRRLVYLLQAVFRFHIRNGAGTVRVEVVRSAATPEAPEASGREASSNAGATDGGGPEGFAVTGDGAPVSSEEFAALLRFDAESKLDAPGLGPAFARAMAEVHGWTVEADAGAGRLVFSTRPG